MKQQVTNFGRFYSAFNKLTIHGERDDTRRQFVLQYTGGRTDSLKEITRSEYNALCAGIETLTGSHDELKRRRSIVLKLMQELDVDTTDWAQINDFCRHPRIAGQPFGKLTIDDLMALATKLRSIKRKGWQRKKDEPASANPQQHITYLINLAGNGMTLPN